MVTVLQSNNTALNGVTAIDSATTSYQEASLAIAQSLSHILADSYLLYLKTQNFHWNVQGNLFYGLHNLLEEQYQEMAIATDALAERIRVLGLSAPGSFRQFLELSSLSEASGVPDAEHMITELAADHQLLVQKLKGVLIQAERAHDISTVELLSGRIATHEKQAWMLTSMVR